VNVVDLDDGIEREEKSTSGTTSVSCQESFNSDQRYSPSAQTDILYSKSPNVVVPELDPPKCVVCMVRPISFNYSTNFFLLCSNNRIVSFPNNIKSFSFFVFRVYCFNLLCVCTKRKTNKKCYFLL
jgi:hypothetical protein